MCLLTHLLRKTYEKDSMGSMLWSRIRLGGKLPPSYFWLSVDQNLMLCLVPLARPANSAVVSLAFGRYLLEPFFAPCAAPVPAVKLVSLLGYCKYTFAPLPASGPLCPGPGVPTGLYLLGLGSCAASLATRSFLLQGAAPGPQRLPRRGKGIPVV